MNLADWFWLRRLGLKTPTETARLLRVRVPAPPVILIDLKQLT